MYLDNMMCNNWCINKSAILDQSCMSGIPLWHHIHIVIALWRLGLSLTYKICQGYTWKYTLVNWPIRGLLSWQVGDKNEYIFMHVKRLLLQIWMNFSYSVIYSEMLNGNISIERSILQNTLITSWCYFRPADNKTIHLLQTLSSYNHVQYRYALPCRMQLLQSVFCCHFLNIRAGNTIFLSL